MGNGHAVLHPGGHAALPLEDVAPRELQILDAAEFIQQAEELIDDGLGERAAEPAASTCEGLPYTPEGGCLCVSGTCEWTTCNSTDPPPPPPRGDGN